MSAMQRRKGRSFEQQIATAYRGLLPHRVVRRSLQAHQPFEPDVVIEGVPVWTECQDARHPTPEKKHQQAVRDIAKAKQHGVIHANVLPVVVWHRIRERESWATFEWSDLAFLLGVDTSKMPSMLVTVTFRDFLAALVVIDDLHRYVKPNGTQTGNGLALG